MNNANAQIAIIALQALLAEAPQLFAAIQSTIGKENVTADDFELLKEQIRDESYAKLVPASKLPPEELKDNFNTPPADPTPPPAAA